MKPKKKWLASFITMLVLKAKAYIWIVITIGVCVVGGYIVYELLKIARLVNQPGTPPPYPETNDVTRVWLENYDGTNGFIYDDEATGVGGPHLTSASESYSGFVTVWYGLDENPWVSMTVPPLASPLLGDTNAYSFVTWANGKTILCGFNRTNEPHYWSYVMNDDQTYYTLVLERSTNLTYWEPVMTDTFVKKWNVCGWYDYEFPCAFYRVRWQ